LRDDAFGYGGRRHSAGEKRGGADAAISAGKIPERMHCAADLVTRRDPVPGLGMIAMGAGGLDVAVAMGGGPFYIKTPKIVGIKLTGKLNDYVSAKDIILEVLRRMGVKGGVGKILEYYGPGVKTLSVPERATITNMGTETGATTSIFPSNIAVQN